MGFHFILNVSLLLVCLADLLRRQRRRRRESLMLYDVKFKSTQNFKILQTRTIIFYLVV